MSETPAAESAAASHGLLASLRGAADSLFALLANRLELLGIELAEERVRLVALLTYGAAAFVALGAGMVFFAMFITVLMWDHNRLLALGLLSALFFGSGFFALMTALSYARKKSPLFSTSLAELRRDRETIKTDAESFK
jgi:uncharacterized membrane protein YqjE